MIFLYALLTILGWKAIKGLFAKSDMAAYQEGCYCFQVLFEAGCVWLLATGVLWLLN